MRLNYVSNYAFRRIRRASVYNLQHAVIYVKTIPVTRRGGPQVCETSRLPDFLDNRLTDGGDVLWFTRWWPYFTSQDD
jgi:hypothetical protein